MVTRNDSDNAFSPLCASAPLREKKDHRHFVWGPDIAGQQTASLESGAEGVGGLLLIREWKPGRGMKQYLPLTDGLGNICGLIDAIDGSLAAEYDYDPYGNPVIESFPNSHIPEFANFSTTCPFRHRTRYYDSESWLYYYGYRYYDPSTTKWISKDPIAEAGGWNLTCFCGNDPVNGFDPTGLEQIYAGTDEEIALLKHFREVISKGSILGKALMDRLDEKGFTVKYQFGTPPSSPTYEGETVPNLKENFGTRSLQAPLLIDGKVDYSLYSSDVYLNKAMFETKDGKVDLNLAFATFIHESVHAYDIASRADLEPEKDRPELTRLLSPPKGTATPKDVQWHGALSAFSTLFLDSVPSREYRAIRGVRGVKIEADKLYKKLVAEKNTTQLEKSFGPKLEYAYQLWNPIPSASLSTHKGAPLPELITQSMIIVNTKEYLDIYISIHGSDNYFRYIW